MSNQTSLSVLLRATTRWGGRLQQLGIHIRKMVAPLVTVNSICGPAFVMQMASLNPIFIQSVFGWYLDSFSINGVVADGNLVTGLSVQTGDALSATLFSWPWCSLPLPAVSHPSCALSPLHHTCMSSLFHLCTPLGSLYMRWSLPHLPSPGLTVCPWGAPQPASRSCLDSLK